MKTARAIIFGKLPHHGDFVARGLNDQRRAAWDDFLTDRLNLARERLGDRFLEAHSAAPPWRFISGPGCFGDDWRAGALTASLDRVGRRFFLVIAIDGLNSAQASAWGEHLSNAMEELIYGVFAHEWSADVALVKAQAAVAAMDAGVGSDMRAAREHWRCITGPAGDAVVCDHSPLELMGDIAAALAFGDAR